MAFTEQEQDARSILSTSLRENISVDTVIRIVWSVVLDYKVPKLNRAQCDLIVDTSVFKTDDIYSWFLEK